MSEDYDYLGPATHPPCEQHDGMPCEPCNKLTELEAQIKNLHEQHRRVSAARNYLHSPLIHQFPLEIVAYIFTLAFPPRDGPPCCVRDPTSFSSLPIPCEGPSPLILAKVCRTWRVLALSTPGLWSDIYVDAAKPNLPLLDHRIAHSGAAPLSIHLFAKAGRIQNMLGTQQAMSLVIKELHRAASFYLDISGDFIRLFNFLCDLNRPKTASLLDELHIHCPARAIRLRLAIKPPRPQHVLLHMIPPNGVDLDWTNICSLKSDQSHIDGLHEVLASKHLKRLVLLYPKFSTRQTHIVSRSVEDLTLGSDSYFLLPISSFPMLQKLDINLDELHEACAFVSEFLRRCESPLQDLTICSWDQCDASSMQALIDVFKVTNMLQRLSLQVLQTDLTPELVSFLRRLSSRDQNLLPRLQTFSMRMTFPPPIDLLLGIIEADEQYSETTNTVTVSAVHELIVEWSTPFGEAHILSRNDLMRILHLRAAGKTISVCYHYFQERPVDVVEYWANIYGIWEL